MSVLVTGGAGYIGSITTRALKKSGRDVVVLDTLENGHQKAVEDTDLVVGDIADQRLVSQVVNKYKVDEVVHFAAYKAVGESMSQPAKYFANNVTGSQRLIEALQQSGVSQIVFSSSAAVYGTPDHVPVSETAPVRCESVYAETKFMIERVLHWYSVTHDVRSVCLRYFNAAGASDDATLGEDWRFSQNLIPHVMKAALGHSDAVQVFGTDYPTPDGTGVRDYIHVEDLAQAHVAALDYLSDNGSTLICNVGTGQGTSVLEILKATEQVTGTPVPHVFTDRRPGDPSSCYADASLIASRLKWKPMRSLADIISSAYTWHSTHPLGHDS